MTNGQQTLYFLFEKITNRTLKEEEIKIKKVNVQIFYKEINVI